MFFNFFPGIPQHKCIDLGQENPARNANKKVTVLRGKPPGQENYIFGVETIEAERLAKRSCAAGRLTGGGDHESIRHVGLSRKERFAFGLVSSHKDLREANKYTCCVVRI